MSDVREGRPASVAVPGLSRLVIFQVGHAYFAAHDRCTHGNALLSEGAQMGSVVYCPLHGGAFDIASGAAISPPCRTPLSLLPIRLEGGGIWLCRNWKQPWASER
ncbi:hypothetical protein CDO46_15030 [Pigmentiphaga sp. NML030171]|nr:hypothetical protein CDO46_15030 [Pigmentiphaga sp. NML030171]